jgi:hypothetical protein
MSGQQVAQAGDQSAPRSEAADAFRETMGNIFDNATKYLNSPGMETSKNDPVQAAKNDILPSPWKASPGAGPSAAAQNGAAGNSLQDVVGAQTKALQEGNKTLRQSFDHAIFVTLVSQVISGVSQTTSTLVRQQ